MRRIRIDLMFEIPEEADTVWAALKNYLKTKQIKNLVNEKSYIDYHECHHDTGGACVTLEHFEV